MARRFFEFHVLIQYLIVIRLALAVTLFLKTTTSHSPLFTSMLTMFPYMKKLVCGSMQSACSEHDPVALD